MTYKVFFEFYGRKMKAELVADSATDAIKKIKSSVIIHKIERVPEPTTYQQQYRQPEDIFGIFGDLFGGVK